MGRGVGLDKDDFFVTTLGDSGVEVRFYASSEGLGKVFLDLDQDCIIDNGEQGIGGRNILIQPGNRILQTYENGNWLLPDLDPGTYTVTLDVSGSWIPTCPTTQNMVIDVNGDPLSVPNFGLVSDDPCSAPDISVQMPFMRKCFSEQYIYVNVANQDYASDWIDSGYVEVRMDSLIRVDSATIPFDSIGPGLYHFPLDTIYPGQQVSFRMATTISCEADLSQTLCVQTTLFPIDSCALDTIPSIFPPWISACPGPWDGSSLEVLGSCISDTSGFDTVQFVIANLGDSMHCYSPVRIYANQDLLFTDSVKLATGEIDTLYLPDDGRTWRVEVDQHPLHPGNSRPNAFVEKCGHTGNFFPNLSSFFYEDDADPQVDIYCGIVTGSYDPNDKTGFPLGVTSQYIIPPGQEINYRIRFQNTGNDTAFTVIIRDTLDPDLDLFTVRSGASSHEYDFTMYGQGILQWTFRNIMLPDSATDEPGSNGFVYFKVQPLSNIPLGTAIQNTTAIYFDFNDPIITNTTLHTVDTLPTQVSWTELVQIEETVCDSLILGNAVFVETGKILQQANDTLFVVDLTVNENSPPTVLIETVCEPFYWDETGLIYTESGIYTQELTNNQACDSIIRLELSIDSINRMVNVSDLSITSLDTSASYQWIDCKKNLLIAGATKATFTPIQSGQYAVILNKMGCQDTSECVDFIPLTNDVFESQPKIMIYPNPTKGTFQLDWDGDQTRGKMVFMDIHGKILWERSLSKGQKITHQISGSPGLYLVGIQIGKAPIRYLKIRKE